VLPLSLVLLALSVETAGAAPAGPQPLAIEDGSGLFHQSAVEQATKEIREIKKDFGIDLFIETTTERPPATEKERREWFWWRKKKFRNQTLDALAEDKADQLREKRNGAFDGIYVLIVDDKHGKREVGVAAWPTSRGADSEVSWVKRDALRDVLLSKDALADPDRALSHLLSRFRAQQRQILEPPPSALGAWSALLVVGGLVGVWLALLFVRWRVNQTARPGDPEPVAIYQPAMMGTLLGLPAAFWVNDELFRALPPEVPPPTRPDDSFSLPPMPTLPEPGALTQGSAEPFTLPPESSDGSPPTTA